jgi:hypothetical protein
LQGLAGAIVLQQGSINYLILNIKEMTYKEVFQLAQDKGYKNYLSDIFSDQYTGTRNEGYGDLEIEAEVKEVEQFLELTLIQKWLREEKQISVVVEDHYSTMDWVARVRPVWALPSENGRLCSSYEQALLFGINEALNLLP